MDTKILIYYHRNKFKIKRQLFLSFRIGKGSAVEEINRSVYLSCLCKRKTTDKCTPEIADALLFVMKLRHFIKLTWILSTLVSTDMLTLNVILTCCSARSCYSPDLNFYSNTLPQGGLGLKSQEKISLLWKFYFLCDIVWLTLKDLFLRRSVRGCTHIT